MLKLHGSQWWPDKWPDHQPKLRFDASHVFEAFTSVSKG
jgi:hypothetical protein